MRNSALILAAVAFAAFLALGFDVVRFGEPPLLDAWRESLVDHSTLVAWWLTWSCYLYVMAPLAVVLLIVAWLAPAWRARIIFSVVMLLLCWRLADLSQHLFARPRPLDWVVKHEATFSYPSSHAAIAAGFYGLWAYLLYMSELPRGVRIASSAALVLFAVAICWSRLALGAHYITDVKGGALLGFSLVAAGAAIFPRALRPPDAGRASTSAE